MRIRNLSEVIEQLRGYLPEYLASFGRETTGRQKTFRCPNDTFHKNGDSNPSAGIVKGNSHLWNCFACGEKGDIFLAAKHIEKLPIVGKGFVDTVELLAERYGVELERDEDAEEIISALEYVASVVQKGIQCPKAQEYIDRRQFTDIAQTFGLGYADPSKLFEILRRTYDTDFISRNELAKPMLFSNRLAIPLHDETGHVVGFAGRTLDDDKRKYINSNNSIIFQKSRFLYNLHRITGQAVYVVEGYSDVWRLWQNGLEAVATCGTAFTEEHLSLLSRSGIKQVTFVYDGDEAGMKAMERTLKIIEQCTTIRFSYITLSATDKDPDQYLQTHGKEAFLSLPQTEIEAPHIKKREQFFNRLVEIEEKILANETAGYRSGWDLYDMSMENIQPGLHLVGGVSNIGKTAWMTHLALNLAERNPDLFVLYVSIDDDLTVQVPRVIANLGSIPVNQVKNPFKFIDQSNLADENKAVQWKRRELGQRRLSKMAQTNLSIVDINDVSTLEDIEREIHIFQQATGKPVAMFLDNFHKIRTKAFNNFKERFTHVSEELKRITSQNNMITYATVELTKLGHDKRPDQESIKESVDIIYDAQTIHMLHQDYHSKQGQTELYFEDARLPFRRLPILEVNVTKNKISGFKGRMYYKFFTDFMYFEECNREEQDKYRKVEV